MNSKLLGTIQLKKTIVILLLFLLPTLNLFSQELLADPDFQAGFIVKSPKYPPDTPIVIDGIVQFDTTQTAIWDFAQWSSNSSLVDIVPTVLANGWYRWENDEKKIHMGPKGQEDYDLLFGINSYNEYGGVYRKYGEWWPHLMVNQRLIPNSPGPGCPSFDKLNNLLFHIEAKLENDSTIIQEGYNPIIHAAQFLLFFPIKNINYSSEDYGKYFWMGVQIYDDRYERPAEVLLHDDATQTLIYSLAYDSVATKSMHSNEWVTFEVDLYKHALKALSIAWSRGYLSDSHNLADYKISDMNMGWEAPGMNIGDMKIRNLSLVANGEVDNDSVHTGNWDFNTDMEGWQGGIDIDSLVWNEGGYISGDVTDVDPQIYSPVDLNINISDSDDTDENQFIYIKMKNISESTYGEIYFITDSEPNYTQDKGHIFYLNQNEENYFEYIIDMRDVEKWDGNLTQLRIDPITFTNSGSFNIDYIKIGSDINSSVYENSPKIKGYLLEQNYPNPFNPNTKINYMLLKSGIVSIKVYNSVGQELVELINKKQNSGNHSVIFNASNLPSGVYMYRINVNGVSNSKKMLLIK